MVKGFSYEVAPDLIRDDPGQSPEHYARLALDRGLALSNSKDPVQSLGSTLRKELREGRMRGFKAVDERGGKRVYPDSMVPSASPILAEDEGLSRQRTVMNVSLSEDLGRVAALLVEVGKSQSTAQAIGWMAAQWCEQNRAYITRVDLAAEQMREIRNAI